MSLWQWVHMVHLREVQWQYEVRRVLPTEPMTAESPDATPTLPPVGSPATLAALAAQFTPEQCAQLVALPQQAKVLRLSEAAGLDAHGLQFVRWLVEHGRLSEDH